MPRKLLTLAEWRARGEALFGPDRTAWRFVCPACKHVAAVADWKAAGAPESAVGFSCVGRWTGGPGTLFQAATLQPCNYAGGGLFALNPVEVTAEDGSTYQMFDFAEPPAEGTPGEG